MVTVFFLMLFVPQTRPISSMVFWLSLSLNVILMCWGMFLPNSQLFGFVFHKGDPDRSTVALTFDDGPHPDSTVRILDILQSQQIRATFFVVGQKAELHPAVVQRMVFEGHEVENHTWNHPATLAVFPLYTLKRIVHDLDRCNKMIRALTEREPLFVRFPAGIKNLPLMTAAKRLNLVVAGFSVRAYDSAGRVSAERIRTRVLERVFPGAIIVLHDSYTRTGRQASTPTIEALPGIITCLKEAGYHFVTLKALYNPVSEGQSLPGSGV